MRFDGFSGFSFPSVSNFAKYREYRMPATCKFRITCVVHACIYLHLSICYRRLNEKEAIVRDFTYYILSPYQKSEISCVSGADNSSQELYV